MCWLFIWIKYRLASLDRIVWTHRAQLNAGQNSCYSTCPVHLVIFTFLGFCCFYIVGRCFYVTFQWNKSHFIRMTKIGNKHTTDRDTLQTSSREGERRFYIISARSKAQCFIHIYFVRLHSSQCIRSRWPWRSIIIMRWDESKWANEPATHIC